MDRRERDTADASGWRTYDLDGAFLWFHPRTGMNVRLDSTVTRAAQRRAPRLVLFGITNHCNLACGFCSRDVHATSDWTVESAFEVLAGLARAGTLEVAFGGGEPLAFRGFEQLVERLVTETPLAVHLTTNATLLDERRLEKLRGLGEIRVSIYDDNPWEERGALLAASDVRFGANVLVTAERIGAVSGLLQRLANVGYRDVALLRYVGPDERLHLSAGEEEQLARVITRSPLPVRLSVCFGDSLATVPRLFGGDCGAGRDFVTITPDRALKSCSFHGAAHPVRSADDVLRVWAEERDALLRPSARRGCARPRTTEERHDHAIRIWRGFSGNNSGDCVLVGRFRTSEEARAYAEELLPTLTVGRFPEAWRQLLAAEKITPDEFEYTPQSIATAGTAVLVHTEAALEDDFPSLRTLLWARGGRAVSHVIHGHEDTRLLAGLGFGDEASCDAAEEELAVDDRVFHRRGLALFGISGKASPVDELPSLAQVAERHRGSISAELVRIDDATDWSAALSKTVAHPGPARLWAAFRTPEQVHALSGLPGHTWVRAGRYVLGELEQFEPWAGALIHRAGGLATWLPAGPMRFEATFVDPAEKRDARGRAQSGSPHERALLQTLRPFAIEDGMSVAVPWRSLHARIATHRPLDLLPVLVQFGELRRLDVYLDAEPMDPVAHAVARIEADLVELGRR